MLSRACQFILLPMVMLVSAGHGLAYGMEPANNFVEQLTQEERTQIGVVAMTPDQVTALEAAVQRYLVAKSESVVRTTESAVRDSLAAEIARRDEMLAQAKLELMETKTALQDKEAEAKESFLDRARVLLRPGTKVEYARIDTQLVEPFNGWKKGTRFLLANGQTWQAMEGEYWSPLKPAGIKASIVPGVLGSFFLEIEGVGPRLRVSLVSP